MTTELSEKLSEALQLQLYAFEQISFGQGKILLNKIPASIVQSLSRNPGMLSKLHREECIVDIDKLIWCYPDFYNISD